MLLWYHIFRERSLLLLRCDWSIWCTESYLMAWSAVIIPEHSKHSTGLTRWIYWILRIWSPLDINWFYFAEHTSSTTSFGMGQHHFISWYLRLRQGKHYSLHFYFMGLCCLINIAYQNRTLLTQISGFCIHSKVINPKV